MQRRRAARARSTDTTAITTSAGDQDVAGPALRACRRARRRGRAGRACASRAAATCSAEPGTNRITREVEQRGERAVAVGAEDAREDDGEDDRDEVRAPSWRRPGRWPCRSPDRSGVLGRLGAGRRRARAACSSPGELISPDDASGTACSTLGRMRVWRRSLAVAGTVLALLPAAAAAQSAGDEQYPTRSRTRGRRRPRATPAPAQPRPGPGRARRRPPPRPPRRRRATPRAGGAAAAHGVGRGRARRAAG